MNQPGVSIQTRRVGVPAHHPRAFGTGQTVGEYTHPTQPRHSAFTLIELLVVIGIIAVLVGLLIPTVSRIRQSGYDTSTRNELLEIANACHHYYDDFRAYPGPISNTDIETGMSPPSPGPGFSQPNMSAQPPNPGSPVIISSTHTALNQGICLNGASYGTTTTTMLFSGSENLTLGLLGGLEIDPNFPQVIFVNGPPTGTTPANPIPQTLVGTGPRSLAPNAANSAGNKQYGAYLPVTFPGSPLLLNGDGTYQNVSAVAPFLPAYHDNIGRCFNNSVVPVLTDQSPDHMPILYLRARVGAPGVISGFTDTGYATPVTNPMITGTPRAFYNYDVREIVPFTSPSAVSANGTPFTSPTGPGTPSAGYGIGGIQSSTAGVTNTTTGVHGLEAVGDGSKSIQKLPYFPVAIPPGTGDHPVPTNQPDNAAEYFINAAVQPTITVTVGTTPDQINATGTPRGKDEFILIAAGRDRTYGTSDDITSFGDVQP